MSKIIVQRSEEGNRTEYTFKSLKQALKFITQSEKIQKTDDGYQISGIYEIYMPRNYKHWKGK